MMSSNVLVCPQPKDIQFSSIKKEKNEIIKIERAGMSKSGYYFLLFTLIPSYKSFYF